MKNYTSLLEDTTMNKIIRHIYLTELSKHPKSIKNIGNFYNIITTSFGVNKLEYSMYNFIKKYKTF